MTGCVWRNVTKNLSVGLSTVKQLNFFIQDLCKSGIWSTRVSWAKITLYYFGVEALHFTPKTLLLIVKSLTSSSQRGMMISHSASHHAESNSTKILLFVPKPNLWMECNLWRGRGGENSVWWCFFRKPERIERKNKSYTQCTGKYLILLLLVLLSVWCWHSKIYPKLWQHKQVEPQTPFLK